MKWILKNISSGDHQTKKKDTKVKLIGSYNQCVMSDYANKFIDSQNNKMFKEAGRYTLFYMKIYFFAEPQYFLSLLYSEA